MVYNWVKEDANMKMHVSIKDRTYGNIKYDISNYKIKANKEKNNYYDDQERVYKTREDVVVGFYPEGMDMKVGILKLPLVESIKLASMILSVAVMGRNDEEAEIAE
jgi:hypothetical protein